MATPTSINAAMSALKAAVDGINAWRLQSTKEKASELARDRFKEQCRLIEDTINHLDSAKPMIREEQWKRVEALGIRVKAARKDLAKKGPREFATAVAPGDLEGSPQDAVDEERVKGGCLKETFSVLGLGWRALFPKTSDKTLETWARLITEDYNAVLNAGLLQPHKTNAEPMDSLYVELKQADDLCAQFRARHQAGAAPGSTAAKPAGPWYHLVRGPPGTGKTSFALSIMHKTEGDRRGKGCFEAGTFYIPVNNSRKLGQEDDKTAILEAQLLLLSKIGCDKTPKTILEAKDEIKCRMEGKRCLIVLDDIWSNEAAYAFVFEGSCATYLITTRECNLDLWSNVVRMDFTGDLIRENKADQEYFLKVALKERAAGYEETEAAKPLLDLCGGCMLAVGVIAAVARDKKVEEWPQLAERFARHLKKRHGGNMQGCYALIATSIVHLLESARGPLFANKPEVWQWMAAFEALAAFPSSRPLPAALIYLTFTQLCGGKGTDYEKFEAIMHELVQRHLVKETIPSRRLEDFEVEQTVGTLGPHLKLYMLHDVMGALLEEHPIGDWRTYLKSCKAGIEDLEQGEPSLTAAVIKSLVQGFKTEDSAKLALTAALVVYGKPQVADSAADLLGLNDGADHNVGPYYNELWTTDDFLVFKTRTERPMSPRVSAAHVLYICVVKAMDQLNKQWRSDPHSGFSELQELDFAVLGQKIDQAFSASQHLSATCQDGDDRSGALLTLCTRALHRMSEDLIFIATESDERVHSALRLLELAATLGRQTKNLDSHSEMAKLKGWQLAALIDQNQLQGASELRRQILEHWKLSRLAPEEYGRLIEEGALHFISAVYQLEGCDKEASKQLSYDLMNQAFQRAPTVYVCGHRNGKFYSEEKLDTKDAEAHLSHLRNEAVTLSELRMEDFARDSFQKSLSKLRYTK